jgi:hypothetical protein
MIANKTLGLGGFVGLLCLGLVHLASDAEPAANAVAAEAATTDRSQPTAKTRGPEESSGEAAEARPLAEDHAVPVPTDDAVLALRDSLATADQPLHVYENLKALERQLAAGELERSDALVELLRDALRLQVLDVANLALSLLADVDPQAFQETVFVVLEEHRGNTIVQGAALLNLDRLAPNVAVAALETTEHAQWKAVRELERAEEPAVGELIQRRGYVRHALLELGKRQSPAEQKRVLLDLGTPSETRHLRSAEALSSDAPLPLDETELRALAGLLGDDLRRASEAAREHARAAHNEPDHPLEPGEAVALDPADGSQLEARIVVLASLPNAAGLAPLRGLLAEGDLPADVAGFAARTVAESTPQAKTH